MDQIISDSLDACAEIAGDITAEVYQRFFATNSDAAALMAHSDDHMQGRMLAETITLLLTDEHFGEEGYLKWEVNNHLLGYGVTVEMYQTYLAAVKDTVQAVLGEHWTQAHHAAWTQRVDRLLREIYSEADLEA